MIVPCTTVEQPGERQRQGQKAKNHDQPSGTEPVVRVMVEGQDGDQVARLTASLAGAVETALNAP